MFRTAPKASPPTIHCPSRLAGLPWNADAATSRMPTRAMVTVRIVWRTAAALMPRMFTQVMASVTTVASNTHVAWILKPATEYM